MSIHDALERTKLPIFLVILIPILAAGYVFFGANPNTVSPKGSSAVNPGGQQTTSQSGTAAPLPAATIALSDPEALPVRVTEGELVPFSFTVQNPSGERATYQYKVSVHWSTGENDVIDENTLSLAADASQTIPEQLKFEIATETATVSFDLPQTRQSLKFEIPKAN